MCSATQLCLTLATPWSVACQAAPSMGSPRQEYWSGLPFPPSEDLPDPGIKAESPESPALQADSLTAETLGKPFTSLNGPQHSTFQLEELSRAC